MKVGVLVESPLQGLVFFMLSLPICLWVIYTDLSKMKIRNVSALALAAVFAVSAPFVMPLESYAWRFVNLAAVLAIGFALNMARVVGAGDAKFAAAMAPFVAVPDWAEVLVLFALLLLITWGGHRVARRLAFVRKLAPHWKSWSGSSDFPMGVALAATHLTYLGLVALKGGA